MGPCSLVQVLALYLVCCVYKWQLVGQQLECGMIPGWMHRYLVAYVHKSGTCYWQSSLFSLRLQPISPRAKLLCEGIALALAGAQNDLERITKMAYSQVAIYGMNEKVKVIYEQLQKHEAPDSAFHRTLRGRPCLSVCQCTLQGLRGASTPEAASLSSLTACLSQVVYSVLHRLSVGLDIPPAWGDVSRQSACTPGHVQVVKLDVACLQVGLVSYPSEEGSFNKPFSNDTAKMIDVEVRKMVQSAYDRTISLLTEKKALVTKLAETLLHKEVRSHRWGSAPHRQHCWPRQDACCRWLASRLVKQWGALFC